MTGSRFAEALHAKRVEVRQPLWHVAQQLGEGWTPARVSGLERSEEIPDYATIHKLATMLGANTLEWADLALYDVEDQQGVGHSYVRWQPGKPTGIGYYWISHYQNKSEPFIADVVIFRDELGVDADGIVTRLHDMDIEWFAGPIPEPRS